MRREVIDCDKCGRELHRTRTGEPAPRLVDFCVYVEITCSPERVKVPGALQPDRHALTICYECADKMFAGVETIGGFIAAAEVVKPKTLQPREKWLRVGRFLDVVVRDGDAKTVDYPATTPALAGGIDAPLVCWPVGTRVIVDNKVDNRPVVVTGYRVRQTMPKGLVTPRCGICDSATDEGDYVVVPYEGRHAEEAICMGCADKLVQPKEAGL